MSCSGLGLACSCDRSGLAEMDFHGLEAEALDLRGAMLKEARYDARTRFPPGFDPAKAGMTATEACRRR